VDTAIEYEATLMLWVFPPFGFCKT